MDWLSSSSFSLKEELLLLPSYPLPASESYLMSTHIPGEHYRVTLHNGEPLEDVDKLEYLGLMFIVNGQDTEKIGGWKSLARNACNPVVGCVVKYSWVKRAGSITSTTGAIDCALRLWNVGSESGRQMDGIRQWQHSTHYIRKVKRMCTNSKSVAVPQSHSYTGTARPEKALSVWLRCETSWGWTDQGPPFAHTASLVAKTSWRPTKDVDSDSWERSGTSLLTASLHFIGDARWALSVWMPTQAQVKRALVFTCSKPLYISV